MAQESSYLSHPLSAVLMVQPVKFYCNAATCVDNAFQQQGEATAGSDGLVEHAAVTSALAAGGVAVRTVRMADAGDVAEPAVVGRRGNPVPTYAPGSEASHAALAEMPDAIFPNNSFSLHEIPVGQLPGSVRQALSRMGSFTTVVVIVLYSMCPGRRNEIPLPLLQHWRRRCRLTVTIDALTGEVLVEENSQSQADPTLLPGVLLDLRPYQDMPAALAASRLSPNPFIGPDASVTDDAVPSPSYPGSADHAPCWVLEGTGAINFTYSIHDYKAGAPSASPLLLAHATASQRCHPILFHRLCDFLGVAGRVLIRNTFDAQRRTIYHTNVVGWTGLGVAGYALDALGFEDNATPAYAFTAADGAGLEESVKSHIQGHAGSFVHPGTLLSDAVYTTRQAFYDHLAAEFGFDPGNKGRVNGGVLVLSIDAMSHFAGNSLPLLVAPKDGHGGQQIIAMSTAARAALRGEDLESPLIEKLRSSLGPSAAPGATIIDIPIPTIERLGGGSVRCLLAAALAITSRGFDSIKDFLFIA